MFYRNKMRKPPNRQAQRHAQRHQRGVSMVELAMGGVVFCTLVFGIIELGRAMATYNALSDAVRRGARYAATQCHKDNVTAPCVAGTETRIKNVVLYGTATPAGGASPVALGLTAANVAVTYSTLPSGATSFGMNSGQVKVEIPNYRFYFNVPLIGSNYRMKPFSATTNAENAGVIPGNI